MGFSEFPEAELLWYTLPKVPQTKRVSHELCGTCAPLLILDYGKPLPV